MKLLQFVLVFSGILALGYAANATWGSKLSNSVLLNTQNVTLYKKNNDYQSSTISFPTSGSVNTKTITYITVTDRFTNSSGPTSTLWTGGVGFTFATINVKSQYAQGINVTAQFWG
ncbi:uncharacterized protein Dwil_GK10198 [Drosophila willistoni]|uniref:Salivary secreted peptide n=1 Tax=Drosophila willistoni TaxID=7260 RepID=B4NDB1_DROWI|nr:uncharacterized protein LOC6648731 [Drosophila willistoni]EDW82820.1 uncharacterized protein Dwil_GK10198 [Drosophila willistoni]